MDKKEYKRRMKLLIVDKYYSHNIKKLKEEYEKSNGVKN